MTSEEPKTRRKERRTDRTKALIEWLGIYTPADDDTGAERTYCLEELCAVSDEYHRYTHDKERWQSIWTDRALKLNVPSAYLQWLISDD